MQQFVGESIFEEESKALWNGRSVCSSQVNPQIDDVQKAVFFVSNELGEYATREKIISIVTSQKSSERNFHPDMILCGEKVDGKASVSGSADAQGNKSVEVEVGISSKDGTFSGSLSGSISQNRAGNASGEVKGKVEARF